MCEFSGPCISCGCLTTADGECPVCDLKVYREDADAVLETYEHRLCFGCGQRFRISTRGCDICESCKLVALSKKGYLVMSSVHLTKLYRRLVKSPAFVRTGGISLHETWLKRMMTRMDLIQKGV